MRIFDVIALFVISTLAIWILQPVLDKSHIFNGDSERYISYAVSLHEHGVFGLSKKDINEIPAPGNANAPFYPVFLAGVMALDNGFAASLKCAAMNGQDANCPQDFEKFFFAQVCLSALCLVFIYLLAVRFSGSKIIGWLAAILALGSGIFTEFSYLFMTEILILPAFSALLLFCLLLFQQRRLRWVFAIALSLAALTLIRPSYLYLFYGFVVFFTAVWIRKKDRRAGLQFAVLVVGFILAVSPWAIRNKIFLNSYTLTSGGYAEAILVQRTNYNQMSWPEVAVAMVYWLPDFGDSIAQNFFPEHLYNKLNWDEGSYYSQGYSKKMKSLSQQLGGENKVLRYLISEEVLTLKHVAVSFPLAIRGVFIAKYWGLAGFLAFVVLLIQSLRRHDYSLALISLPVFFMVAFHAGLSVSIPRYNLPLVALDALSLAWYINLYGHSIAFKIRNR